VATSSNRHPIALLGAAASLITVLGFFGVRSWPGSEPPTPVASTQAVTPSTVVVTQPAAPAPSTTCSCPTRTPAPPPLVKVSCVIEDRLGEGQVAEAVTLRFGTKEWQLNIDESDPTDRLTLRFPHAGSYRYTVETVTETTDGATVHGAGEGTIACRGGQTFQLAGDYGSGQLITVTLQEA
jgi:hypothetical protein